MKKKWNEMERDREENENKKRMKGKWKEAIKVVTKKTHNY